MIMPLRATPPNLYNKQVGQYKFQSPEPKGEQSQHTRTSIFYINDFHGKSINMERTVSASNGFDSFVPSQKTDKLKLSSGDIMLGENLTSNKVAVEAQNAMGIMASAMGNHEYDMPKDIDKLIPQMGYKMLACNISITPNNPLAKKVEKSTIVEQNGHKYGIVGATPVDLFSRLKHGKLFDDLKIHNINDTINDIQAEVDNLKKQGVDKIILLSHVGFVYDQKIAKETDGVDVILGGHSHDLLNNVNHDVNLLKSKSGDPVVITQAGRDGKNFGILNLEFNENGILTKVQNSVSSTRKFKRNAPARYAFEQILGKPKVVGKINSAPPPLVNDGIEPSAHANFMVDCMKEEADTDIALFGSATVRGYFEAGKIDTRSIEDLSPFKNKIVVAKINEKEIVEALKKSSKSLTSTNNKPGIIHVSGLRYTISKNGELKTLSFVDKAGKENSIDIQNPSDKVYRVALTDYYAEGHDGFSSLNKMNEAEKVYDYDVCKAIEHYFERHKEPVDIVDDGRIKIVD